MKINFLINIIFNYRKIKHKRGLGIGDWGFGIWGFGPRPKTQKPKPQTKTPI